MKRPAVAETAENDPAKNEDVAGAVGKKELKSTSPTPKKRPAAAPRYALLLDDDDFEADTLPLEGTRSEQECQGEGEEEEDANKDECEEEVGEKYAVGDDRETVEYEDEEKCCEEGKKHDEDEGGPEDGGESPIAVTSATLS